MIAGQLDGLRITAPPTVGDARYELAIGAECVHLNDLLGRGLRIKLRPQKHCRHCQKAVTKLQRGGYCGNCFFALARCDTCFVNPQRCHFALGTCREPDWGMQTCMQPHVVYLANSGGLKVGLTQDQKQQQRWLSQGATQGLVIARATSRRAAGILEATIAQQISDRTQWRKMVALAPVPVDLQAVRQRLQQSVELAADCQWVTDATEQQLTYPVQEYAPPRQHQLNADKLELADNLVGIKGQYLLLQHGVFNVARHVGLNIELSITTPISVLEAHQSDQLSLF